MVVATQRAAVERELSLREAVSLVEREYSCRGLRVDVSDALTPEANFSYHILVAELFDPSGENITRGVGKGSGYQALASALFEGFEHYALHVWRGCSRRMTLEEIAQQPGLVQCHFIQRMAKDFPAGRLDCIRFQPLLPSGNPEWFPVKLVNPAYASDIDDEAQLIGYFNYGSNSGSASGSTRSEALLHGLLELIERDGASLAALDWFADPKRTVPSRVIRLQSFPEDLQALAEFVRRNLGVEPAVINVTSDLGIPCVLAIPSQSIGDVGLGLFGAGASFSLGYAIERALGELVQCYLGRKSPTVGSPTPLQCKYDLAELRRWPCISATAELNPGQVLSLREVIDFKEAENLHRSTAEEQVPRISQILAKKGYQAWYYDWTGPDSQVAVVTVRVPELEHFFIHVAGFQAVLPTGRGWNRFARPV